MWSTLFLNRGIIKMNLIKQIIETLQVTDYAYDSDVVISILFLDDVTIEST